MQSPLLPQLPLNHPETFEELLEPRRWLILLTLSLHICFNGMCWLTYYSIIPAAKAYFQIEEYSLIAFSASYLLAFISLSLLGSWLVFHTLQKSLLGCLLLSTLGAWIKYAANGSYVVGIVGQMLLGVSIAPIFAFIKSISEGWFPVKEREIVRIIIILAAYMGWTLGSILPAQIIEDNPANIPTYELIQAIITTVPLIFGFFFVKDKPECPPSYAAMAKISEFPTLREEIKYFLSMPRVFITTVAVGSGIGISITLPTISSFALNAFYLSSFHQGMLGVMYICGGFAAKIAQELMKKFLGQLDYDKIMKILNILSLIGLICLGVVVHIIMTANLVALYILNFFLGFGLLGFIPFACGSIGQSTFPVQELLSKNVTILFAAIFGIFEVYFTATNVFKTNEYFVLAVLFIPCWIFLLFFYKTDYKRMKFEARNKELDAEFEKFYGGKVLFRSLSPIKMESSVPFLPYNGLSTLSKDLIMSTPVTPIIKDTHKLPRSFSSNTCDKNNKNEAAKLFELVEIS